MSDVLKKYYSDLDQKSIQAFLPHRHPFLFVDRIICIEGNEGADTDEPKKKVGVRVVGQKNVSINEGFFEGHFPNAPVMPGVLIIETMAQVASFSMYPAAIKKIQEMKESYQCVLVGVDGARFRIPVVPGDVLRIETKVISCRTSLWTFECQATVNDKVVAEAKLLANVIPISTRQIF